jgi:hypothetical protein
MVMRESNQKGICRPLPLHRRLMVDLMNLSKRFPTIPVARTMKLGAVVSARGACPARPSWTSLFMKAYSIVCQRNPKLRQLLMTFPWEYLYEHPISLCQVAIERELNGEKVLLPAQVRSPDLQPLTQINDYLRRCKEAPIDDIGYFRQVFQGGRLPKPVRSVLWWMAFNLSACRRAKHLGTFGLTSYGRLGAEQLHPLGPQTTVLTFGPFSDFGEVVVKIVYDHRVLDGAEMARRLVELEDTLHSEIIAELRSPISPAQDTSGVDWPAGTPLKRHAA